MALKGEYEPSQNDRTREQVELYEATDGVKGGRLNEKRACEVLGKEKDEWWKRADAAYPEFPAYRARAGREIPLLVLEPLQA